MWKCVGTSRLMYLCIQKKNENRIIPSDSEFITESQIACVPFQSCWYSLTKKYNLLITIWLKLSLHLFAKNFGVWAVIGAK